MAAGNVTCSRPARKYRGVRQRQWGSWVSEIRHSLTKTRVWLGTFHTAKEAAKAYDQAARLMDGPKAKTNFPASASSSTSSSSSSSTSLLSPAVVAKLHRCKLIVTLQGNHNNTNNHPTTTPSSLLPPKATFKKLLHEAAAPSAAATSAPPIPPTFAPQPPAQQQHFHHHHPHYYSPLSTSSNSSTSAASPSSSSEGRSLVCLRLDAERCHVGVWQKAAGRASQPHWIATSLSLLHVAGPGGEASPPSFSAQWQDATSAASYGPAEPPLHDLDHLEASHVGPLFALDDVAPSTSPSCEYADDHQQEQQQHEGFVGGLDLVEACQLYFNLPPMLFPDSTSSSHHELFTDQLWPSAL